MAPNNMWFARKFFLVTGGSSGIGLAISKELLSRGARVIIVSYNPVEFKRAEETFKSIPGVDGKYEFLKCDITSLDDIQALKSKLEPKREDLAGLVNNAGITTYGPFFHTPTPSIHRLMQINFVGPIMVTKVLFPLFLATNPTKKTIRYLVFTSSTSGIVPFPYVGGYPGCKAGVEMFLKTLQFEFPSYVRYLVMRPGPVKTNLYDSATTAPGAKVDDLLAFSKGKNLLEPEQVARPLVDRIAKKKGGVLYPSFGTKMLFNLMKLPLMGKPMIRYVSKELRKRFTEED